MARKSSINCVPSIHHPPPHHPPPHPPPHRFVRSDFPQSRCVFVFGISSASQRGGGEGVRYRVLSFFFWSITEFFWSIIQSNLVWLPWLGFSFMARGFSSISARITEFWSIITTSNLVFLSPHWVTMIYRVFSIDYPIRPGLTALTGFFFDGPWFESIFTGFPSLSHSVTMNYRVFIDNDPIKPGLTALTGFFFDGPWLKSILKDFFR